MPFELLIDGYNLLHAAGWGKASTARGHLQRRRARLLSHLGERLDVEVQKKTVVVFDARHAPPDDPVNEPGSERWLITVQFAPRTMEADDVIEELLAKHSVPKSVLVVSSDHRIQKAARRRGAQAVDSEVFLDQIEDDDAHSRSNRQPKASKLPDGGQQNPDDLLKGAEEELQKALRSEETRPASSAEPPSETPRPVAPIDKLDDPKFWEERIQVDAASKKNRRKR